MKILVFLPGTTIMHRSGVGVPRAERVQQVASGTDPSVRDFAGYVAIGDAARRLAGWQAQGATLAYLSSHRREEDVAHDLAVLRRCGFPPGEVLFRRPGECYVDVVERAAPDVLIEDDCESLGADATAEMVTPHLSPPARQHIELIVVAEFGGIDDLPANAAELGEHPADEAGQHPVPNQNHRRMSGA